MTELAPNELTLTPDQRRRLGHVYRLILSWRRERINGMQKLPQEQPKGGQAQSAQIDSDPASPIESES
jgi:hypothetical protein